MAFQAQNAVLLRRNRSFATLTVGSATYAVLPPPALDPAHAPHFNPVVYALDLLLPVVDLGQKHAYNPSGAGQWLSYALIAAGWILVTTIAAGAAHTEPGLRAALLEAERVDAMGRPAPERVPMILGTVNGLIPGFRCIVGAAVPAMGLGGAAVRPVSSRARLLAPSIPPQVSEGVHLLNYRLPALPRGGSRSP